MTSLEFVRQYNELNYLCYDVIHYKIENDVEFYRYRLGFHFDFDFKYMIIREQTTGEITIHGAGKRLRDYDLLLKYLWDIPVEQYVSIKNGVYKKYENEIKKTIESYDTKQRYCILNHGDVEHDEFLTLMTKYFQIYTIENIDKLNYDFNLYYNQASNNPYREPCE